VAQQVVAQTIGVALVGRGQVAHAFGFGLAHGGHALATA
jgi:hypothetical protein